MRQAVIPESLHDAVTATGFSPAIRAGELLFLTGAGLAPRIVAHVPPSQNP